MFVPLTSQAALLARGRTVRQAKLQFFAKMAEKGLSCYERDGWGEFPTQINPDRREVGLAAPSPTTIHMLLRMLCEDTCIAMSKCMALAAAAGRMPNRTLTSGSVAGRQD